MRGTPLGRPRLALRCAWHMRVLCLLLGLMSAGRVHAEDVVIPYECDMRMGDVRLVPSEPRPYRIFGSRDRQIYSACDPQDPGQCKNYQIHRFDIDCGGTRVSWLKVAEAAARLDGERVSVKRNQMLLEVEPQGDQAAEPYPRDGRWDPDRRNSGDPYGVAQGDAVVSFPPGFAPAIGMKPIFTGRDPAQVQQLPPAGGGAGTPSSGYGVPYDAAESGGWDTEAKGWSQSPKGVPVDQDAQTGWDAERVISSGPEGTPNSAAKPAPVSKSSAAAAGSKTPGASYGTGTVTSQKLPEIGARPAKSADAGKKTAAAAASSDPVKATQKKSAVKPVETAAKPEPPKQDVAKAEVPKAEPANEVPKAEASKSEPAKTEPAKSEPDKTETAMVEPPKPEVTAAAKSEAPKADVKSDPVSVAAVPEQPHMLNGRDASAPTSAKSDVAPLQPSAEPIAPLAAVSPPPQSAAPSETAAPSAALAPVTAAPGEPPPLASPDPTTVVAEAAPKTPDTTTTIETSSISIVGQKVPVSSAWYLAAAALLTAAGFFFMMRRGQEVEAGAYVERDITRVSLGAAGEGGARLTGPSFELPMPDLAPRVMAPETAIYDSPIEPVQDASMLVPEPCDPMALRMMPAMEPPAPPMMEPRPQVMVPDMSLMSDIRSRLAPPVDEITVQVPIEVASPVFAEMGPQSDMTATAGDEPAPEAVELARAIAEGSDAISEVSDETRPG